MNRSTTPQSTTRWLTEHGPNALESLFRSIVFHPSTPILIADDDRRYQEASIGASRLLGLPRGEIIGRRIDEFVKFDAIPLISERWRAFLEAGEQVGTLTLLDSDGSSREVEYTAKGNVLPARHLLVLHDSAPNTKGRSDAGSSRILIPSWVQDYALFLLDVNGDIAAWYDGAERLYGYGSAEAVGQHGSLLDAAEDKQQGKQELELRTADAEGHFGADEWQVKKDGGRFWANVITMALKDEAGVLQGFARVARDFSDRRKLDEKIRHERAQLRLAITEHATSGVVSGEFDRIPDANYTFLQLVGYTREDFLAGRLNWSELTPLEYQNLDDLAHEEALRTGSSTPFEKEFIRRDGSRVPVLVSTTVLTLSPFRWVTIVQDVRELDRLEAIGAAAVASPPDCQEILGSSAAIKRVTGQVAVVAPTDATVLVLGETGTGKELVARAIHRMSPRSNFPFISLNCAAIPTGLLESELFGYERGAFTGALNQKIGRFELANRGTLFLDEVGDIPLELQPKLLRALQEKSFERLGGTKTIPINVRLIAATNRDLGHMMADKSFRSDLYYRLKVFPITTPPLRERPEDIPELVRHFTRKYAEKMQRRIDKIPSQTMDALVSWSWPGNVRELENFIERSVILSRGSRLAAPVQELTIEPVKVPAGGTLEEIEREYIQRILHATGGVVSVAAARLGMPRTTLNAIMKKLGISRGGP